MTPPGSVPGVRMCPDGTRPRRTENTAMKMIDTQEIGADLWRQRGAQDGHGRIARQQPEQPEHHGGEHRDGAEREEPPPEEVAAKAAGARGQRPYLLGSVSRPRASHW